MSKILGSWSGMRKYLEEEMLAKSLKGRIHYGCTSYKGMDGDRIFDVWIDSEQIKRFSMETVNSYFIKNGYTLNKNPFGITEYWDEFWKLMNKYKILEREEYTDREFCDALATYRENDIQNSIFSPNPIVRMFAILDRRIGKRTLQKLKFEIENQPPWLQEFYKLRINTEL